MVCLFSFFQNVEVWSPENQHRFPLVLPRAKKQHGGANRRNKNLIRTQSFFNITVFSVQACYNVYMKGGPVRVLGLWIIRGFLEKGYGLLASKLTDYGLFVLHFKITDYYQSLSHNDYLYIKMVLKGLKSTSY